MKALFVALVAVHGLIHFMGFAKGYGLAEVEGLQQPISRGMALVWLFAAIGFLATAALLVVTPRYFWMAAVPAIVLSQIAIVTSWGDAKFGTLANLIILVPVALSIADLRSSSLRSRFDRDVQTEFAERPAAAVVTDGDLQGLPPLIETYLRRVGVVGHPRVHDFVVRFRGEMRNGRDARWMKMRAEQHERFGEQPARLFLMHAAMFGVPFDAYHHKLGPTATMEVKAASVFPMVDARGAEMDQSETVTLFNDMCLMAPAALLDADVAFNTVDAHTVHATFANAGITIHADLIFNDDGDLVNFVSYDRYMTSDGKTMEKYPWSTPIRDYRDFGGMRIAAHGEAVWTMPDGDFTYGRFNIEELRYNVAPEARATEERPRISLRGALQH